MASKWILAVTLNFILVAVITGELFTSPEKKTLQSKHIIAPRSCLEYLKSGSKTSGHYVIYINGRKSLTVYCDMTSEPGAVWTLVVSFALRNKEMPQFKTRPYYLNAPVNGQFPNKNAYRMTLADMNRVKSQSTHWRITCNFPTKHVDYVDYVRAKFSSFNIMSFNGRGVCKPVEYVSIRDHQCADCTSKWWQFDGNTAHIDSSHASCQFNPSQGASHAGLGGVGEDNFGYYIGVNSRFRCSASPLSTTNIWFGGKFSSQMFL